MVNQRVATMIVSTSKMSAGVLARAMQKFLANEHQAINRHAIERQNGKAQEHGKIKFKDLMAQNTGTEDLPIKKYNIHTFDKVAKKYNIDYAIKKDSSGDIPKYFIFFKSRDRASMTLAFKEFMKKNEEERLKKPMKQKLREYEELRKAVNKKRSSIGDIDKEFNKVANELARLEVLEHKKKELKLFLEIEGHNGRGERKLINEFKR